MLLQLFRPAKPSVSARVRRGARNGIARATIRRRTLSLSARSIGVIRLRQKISMNFVRCRSDSRGPEWRHGIHFGCLADLAQRRDNGLGGFTPLTPTAESGSGA